MNRILQLRIRKRIAGLMMVLVLLVPMILPYQEIIAYGEGEKIRDFLVSVDKESVLSGESFTYKIDYAYSSNDEAFEGEKILVTLPEPLEFVSVETSSDVASVDSDVNPVIFYMNDMDAGTTGFVKLTARFRPGSITEETAITSIVTDEAITEMPLVPTVTATIDDEWSWGINKERTTPDASIDPVPGTEVTYRITMQGNASLGGVNIPDAVLTDTLPENAEFVTASDDGEYEDGVVTWSVGTLLAGTQQTVTVTVRYPAEEVDPANPDVILVPGFSPEDSVVNSAELRTGEESITSSDTLNFSVPAPGIGNLSKRSRQENDRYEKGQNMSFVISGFGNTGNVPLNDVVLIDTIPDGMDLTSVSDGDADTVSYQLYGSEEWMDWSNPSAKPDMEDGQFITKVRWTYAELPVGYSPPSIDAVGPLLNQYRQGIDAGTPVERNDSLVNTVTLAANYGEEPLPSDEASVTIVVGLVDEDHAPWLVVTKECSSASAYPGDEVGYTVRIKNHAYATGDLELTGDTKITVTDSLPLESDAVTPVFSAVTSGVLTGTAEANGAISEVYSDNQLQWELTGTHLKPGQYVDITYVATAEDQALVGSKTNTVTVMPDGAVYIDPRAGAAPFTASESLYIKFTGSLKSVKAIKGHNDVEFTYADVAPVTKTTFHGGRVRYQVKVSNDNANGPISNVVIIDKLPKSGDRGVIVPTLRGSEWEPYLINEVTGDGGAALPTGVTVYYSESGSPDTSKLYNPLGTDSGWSATPPEDITKVRALKFEFGNIVFQPGDDSIILEWDMRAPADAPVNKIAWNSFAYGATHEDINGSGAIIQAPFLPAEPIKVGMLVEPVVLPMVSLGDYIWEDLNKDGIQNDGEIGLNGILVNLYKDGNLIGHTRTGDSHDGTPGYYLFPELSQGNGYVVEFEMPLYDSQGNAADFYITTQDAVGGAESGDSDFALFNTEQRLYRTASINLTTDNLDIDAGIYRKASLGDHVWNDRDRDGVQDAGEPAVRNIAVKLLRFSDGVEVASTSTDDDGKYLFDDMDPGSYLVTFTLPSSDYGFTNAGSGTAATGSDVTGTAGLVGSTGEVTLVSDQHRTDIDAGIVLGRLGDLVWHDYDADGIQDSGEPGINAATVRLRDHDGNPVTDAFGNLVGDTTTNSSGAYVFNDLKAGTYVIEFMMPAGYAKRSPGIQGADISKDSNASLETGKSGNTVLVAAGQDMTIDAGFYKLASIGDKIWLDSDADGYQDGSETGISGITVRLLNGDGTPAVYGDGNAVAPTVTAANGTYLFSGLEPGTYKVQFENADITRIFTLSNTGSDSYDSDGIPDAHHTLATTGVYTLRSIDNPRTVDAGLHPITPGITIEKTVYAGYDNGNSVGTELIAMPENSQVTYLFRVTNTGNVGLKDVTVIDAALNINQSNMTLKTGNASLLTPGASVTWYYETTLEDDLTNTAVTEGTPSYTGSNETIDVSKPTASDTAEVAVVVPGINLEKTVYEGHDDGAQTGGELVAANTGTLVTYVFTITNTTNRHLRDIVLTDTDLNRTKATLIKKSGTEPLAPGAVLVYYYETTLTGNLINHASTEGTPCNGAGIIYTDAQHPTDQDIAEVQVASTIGDTVWYDTDGDGLQDGDEVGIGGVTVELWRNGTLYRSASTTETGYYSFIDLQSGEYTVKIITSSLPTGYVQSGDRDGTLDHTTNVALGTNHHIVDADFGYKPVPYLYINKIADRTNARVGETISYTITVRNTGKAKLTNVTVTDVMLGLNETVEVLEVGAAPLIYTGTHTVVAADLPGPLINTAIADCDETDQEQGSVSVLVSRKNSGGGGGTPPVTPDPPVTPETPSVPVPDPPTEPTGPSPGPTILPIKTVIDEPIVIDDDMPPGGTIIKNPDHGTVTIDPDGNMVYSPEAGYVGPDSFIISDSEGGEKMIEIDVEDVPLGAVVLPKTGELPSELFIGLGGLLILLGLALKTKFNRSY